MWTAKYLCKNTDTKVFIRITRLLQFCKYNGQGLGCKKLNEHLKLGMTSIVKGKYLITSKATYNQHFIGTICKIDFGKTSSSIIRTSIPPASCASVFYFRILNFLNGNEECVPLSMQLKFPVIFTTVTTNTEKGRHNNFMLNAIISFIVC